MKGFIVSGSDLASTRSNQPPAIPGAAMHQGRTVELGRMLAHHAVARPDSLAISGAARLNFGMLNRRANRMANALITVAGLHAGDRVALRLPNSHRHFECLFACAKTATVLVPIDGSASADEATNIVRDTGAALLLDSEETFESLVAQASDFEPTIKAGETDPLLIMQTSGTTGRSKGAVLTQANVIYTCLNQLLGWQLTASDRALVVAGFHHAGGLLALGLPSLYAGGSIHIAPPVPEVILERIACDRITAMFLPPRLWTRLAFAATLGSADLTSVRLCAAGGDPIPLAMLDRLMDRFKAEFTGAYGLTEAASCSTLLRGADLKRRHGSAGKALPHNRIRVMNIDGTEAAPGEIGEVVQEGPTVMQGYWRRPKETAIAIRDGELWTGDLGFIDQEGFLFILGRRTDVIKSGDIEIYPSEIERSLREYAPIEDAAVLGVPDDRLGETIGACVVPRDNSELTVADVAAYCTYKLPETKRPTKISLRRDLPRNPNGKVIKASLREDFVGITQLGNC